MNIRAHSEFLIHHFRNIRVEIWAYVLERLCSMFPKLIHVLFSDPSGCLVVL